MSSQEKFVENGNGVSSLLSIRDELYRNTVQIIDLVRERIRLAEMIGREKESLGIPLRNRERELEIIDSIPELGDIEKTVLNMIFELTIQNEASERPKIRLHDSNEEKEEEIVLAGPDGLLHYSMGLLISHPGFELRDMVGVPENLALGVVQRGGHITSGARSIGASNITLTGNDGQKLAAIEKGRLVISRILLEGDSRNEVMEAI